MKNNRKRTFKHLALGLVLAAGLTTAAKASLVGLPVIYPGFSPTPFSASGGGVSVGAGPSYVPTIAGLIPEGSLTTTFGNSDYKGTLTSEAYKDGTGTLIAFILKQTAGPQKIINLTLDYYPTA